ncbi:MAG: MIP/aquaporin family protein [Anaerobutyricum hallii]
MLHSLIAEFLGTALMILFGVGVHCDEVLTKTKYHGSGHIFAITTWAFGISVTLFIFGGVCINPAMALCQAILGMIPWSNFIPYCIAEFLGALFGSLVVYVMYTDHFKASEGKIDPIAIRNIFSTNPNCRNLPRNFLSRQSQQLFS